MAIFEYKTKTNFSDINFNNQLSQTGLMRILNEAAGLHSDSLGYGLNNSKNNHLSWMLLNWKIQTISRPSWNSEITVRTWPRTINKLFSYRDFEVLDKDGNIIAKASSKWVLVNFETHSIMRISDEIINAFGETDKHSFDYDIDDKEKAPQDSKFAYEYQIKRRDIDTNLHVNNLYYLQYAYEALPEEFVTMEFDNIEILYKKQIKYHDIIKCFYYYDTEKKQHIVTIKNEDETIVHSIIKMY